MAIFSRFFNNLLVVFNHVNLYNLLSTRLPYFEASFSPCLDYLFTTLHLVNGDFCTLFQGILLSLLKLNVKGQAKYRRNIACADKS